MTIRVLINGAQGRMGSEAVKAVQAHTDLQLVGKADQGDDLEQVMRLTDPQVVVDFTHPYAAYANTLAILNAGRRPVVGTTGFKPEEIARLEQLAAEKKLGGLIAPNFAIGAILMMRFAQEAARHMPHAEIIELHHDQKADAPSGTAIKTAEMIAQARPQPPAPKVAETELAPGARGTKAYAVPIHSVRLPGYVAHQEVIFGALGQTLSIRHDTINRESFMPGVILGIQGVMTVERLVYGLEHFL